MNAYMLSPAQIEYLADLGHILGTDEYINDADEWVFNDENRQERFAMLWEANADSVRRQ